MNLEDINHESILITIPFPKYKRDNKERIGIWGIIGIINVSIITIIERKLLSFLQRRYGPKRYILQAIIDGIKIIIKERIYIKDMKYYISSIYSLIISIIIWEILPINYKYNEINIKYTIILFVLLSSLNIYPIIYGGIGSNNKYTMLSIIRGINQLISYEINITITIISIIYLSKSFNLHDIYLSNLDNYIFLPIFLILFISLLAESYRLPFDFLEGESEIVGRKNYRICKYRIYINIYNRIFYDYN